MDSIEKARRTLITNHFDLAVLDMTLTMESGPDPLPDLRDSNGNAIKTIVLSAQGAKLVNDAQIKAPLTKEHASIGALVAAACDRLISRAPTAAKQVVDAP